MGEIGLDTCKKLFPVEYRALVESIADELVIDISQLDLTQSSELCDAVRFMHQKNKTANKRYTRLIIAINEIVDNSQVVSMLEKYIKEETFDFYRQLAIEYLTDFRS